MTVKQTILSRVDSMNNHYAISHEELEFILSAALLLPPHPTILELGVCHGRTLAALGLVAGLLEGTATGIDFFGLEGSSPGMTMLEISRRGVDMKRCRILVGNTHSVEWDQPLDLLVVDAGHDEDNVRPDIERYVPLVKPGGYVFFDDYDDPYDPKSPHWAVRHWADYACGHWKDLGIVDSMRGWQRP